MKLLIDLNGKKLVVSPEQAEQLLDLLDGAEFVDTTYVGGTKGDNGTAYAQLVGKTKAGEMAVSLMRDDDYNALVLKTKLHHENS